MSATAPKAPGDVLGAVFVEATQSLRTSSTGVGGGGTSTTDDDAFTPGSGALTPAGGIYRSVLDAVDDGDAGAFAMTINRALHSHLVNPTGTPVVTATTDIAGGADLGLVVRVASAPASGGGTQYTEGDTDVSVTGTALMFESNTGTNTLSVVNATTPLPVTGTVTVTATNLDIRDLTAASDSVIAVGVVAHDAPWSSNPLVIAGSASAAAQADVSADGDAVKAWFLRNGAQATVLTAAGALIGGDAAQGLDVDVTRSALPTGASTAAKQPALGTAGTASTDVLTVQGIAAMTPLLATLSGTNNIATVTTVSAVTAISNALPAGDNNIGNMDIVSLPDEGQQTMANSISVAIASNQSAVPTTVATATTGGCSFFKSIDLDETEEQIKATAATFYGGIVMNLTNALLYFKLYNATAANVVVGTTVPDLTIPIPANNDVDGAGFTLPIPPQGVAFGTALTAAVTTGIADNDSGAPAANACAVALWYA